MVILMSPVTRDLRTLLGPLLELAGECVDVIGTMAGSFSSHGRRYGIPRFVFTGPKAAHDTPVVLFAQHFFHFVFRGRRAVSETVASRQPVE